MVIKMIANKLDENVAPDLIRAIKNARDDVSIEDQGIGAYEAWGNCGSHHEWCVVGEFTDVEVVIDYSDASNDILEHVDFDSKEEVDEFFSDLVWDVLGEDAEFKYNSHDNIPDDAPNRAYRQTPLCEAEYQVEAHDITVNKDKTVAMILRWEEA